MSLDNLNTTGTRDMNNPSGSCKIRPIIVDTREQRSWEFPYSIRAKLDAGDYSLQGLESRIAIERKSLDDYINTVLRASARFRRELEKLQQMDYAAVVVECSYSDMLSGQYEAKIHPSALAGITTQLMLEFHPVQFLFIGERPDAMAFVGRLLAALDKRYSKIEDSKLEAEKWGGMDEQTSMV